MRNIYKKVLGVKGASLIYNTIMLFFLVLQVGYAQVQVQGLVTSEDGSMPLAGVTVIEKGSNNGVVTNFDGNYSILIQSNEATLVFSYLGFETVEKTVGQNTTLNISMVEDLMALDEVVVVDYGYGQVRKENMTGAVASISAKEIAKIPVSSTAEALAGRLPGVKVTTSDGEPGAEITIRIRGGGSITQDNSPLYVVDGFIVSSISDIPPTDILSIDVLKDAAATSIYGAQASNGVVVITTKNPTAGSVDVSYNNFFQFNTLPKDRRYEVLSPYEFVLANYEYALLRGETDVQRFERFFGVYDDIELYKSKKGTDWQEELFGGERVSMFHNLTVSGGTEMTKMRLSLSKNEDEGLLEGSNYDRIAANFKLNQKIGEKLTLDIATRITSTEINGAGTSTSSQLKIKDAIQTRPVNGIADELDIDLNTINSEDDFQSFLLNLVNPRELVKQDWRKRNDNDYVFNTGLTWKINDFLSLKTNYTNNRRFRKQLRFYGPLTSESYQNGGSMPLGEKTETEYTSYRLINILNFSKSWDNQNLDVVLGQESSSSGGNQFFLRAEDFRQSITPEELFANMAFGRAERHYTRDFTNSNRLSYFGRLDYQYNDIIVITGSFRADQSSRFSKENRLGIFPSTAFAIKLHEFDALKDVNFINQLKLRIAYGETGNDRIDATATQFLFSATTDRGVGFNNVFNVYYQPSSSALYNPDLVWETTASANLGLDFAFVDNKFRGSLDIYQNTTTDLLLQSVIPNNTGFNTQWNNVGSTQNKGIELGLTADLIRKDDLNLSLDVNIGKNDFTIVELDGTTERFERSNWASTDLNNINDFYLKLGGRLGDIYGYETDGFYTASDFAAYDPVSGEYTLNEGIPSSGAVVGNTKIRPGFLKLKDLNGDGEINADDRTVIGNTTPDFQGGFGVNLNFKNFDFSSFFNFQVGNDVYNTGKIQYNQFRRVTFGNMLDTMNSSNRYSYVDVDGSYTGVAGGLVTDLATLDQMNQGKNIWSHGSHGIAGAVIHSWAVEDGSFLRLNNLTIGYTLPEDISKKIGVSRLRVFATGRNLKIWTKYSGYDPEVDNIKNPLTPGVDYSSFPRSRSYTVGINLNF